MSCAATHTHTINRSDLLSHVGTSTPKSYHQHLQHHRRGDRTQTMDNGLWLIGPLVAISGASFRAIVVSDVFARACVCVVRLSDIANIVRLRSFSRFV